VDLYEELKAVIDRLNRERIDYAVCGGIAVALHGYLRFTQDLDILVQKEDVDRISRAVRDLGFLFDAGRIPFNVGGPNQREIHRISKIEEEEVLTLDLLLVGSVYEEVWAGRRSFDWEGRELKIVALDGLLEMKRMAGRDKDLLDIKELTRKGEEKNG
jgi:predicted nucleotidyltransferase